MSPQPSWRSNDKTSASMAAILARPSRTSLEKRLRIILLTPKVGHQPQGCPAPTTISVSVGPSNYQFNGVLAESPETLARADSGGIPF